MTATPSYHLIRSCVTKNRGSVRLNIFEPLKPTSVQENARGTLRLMKKLNKHLLINGGSFLTTQRGKFFLILWKIYRLARKQRIPNFINTIFLQNKYERIGLCSPPEKFWAISVFRKPFYRTFSVFFEYFKNVLEYQNGWEFFRCRKSTYI